ncbi:uncharacterized protein TRIADDRAFT_54305 [Trichoplax adhaerens]|uniref:Small monomeric GTPase n=1 Tax=Trichoplax adhaerens TaxID=10228 RepID=B3RRN5_TRIAD|nr:hypothetical protein TRIADDRAFT_54305 [Trichoplax adhaerens]EDV26899.1 hypothetical protein TRIADDRAFT_54305 [Trichoplax adhaerens]|eukprot:XP_002110895.1 hypothetical protein TRIADDRAFT_54305 [Trichoplax adhaerens]
MVRYYPNSKLEVSRDDMIVMNYYRLSTSIITWLTLGQIFIVYYSESIDVHSFYLPEFFSNVVNGEPYTTIEDIYDIILESDRGIKERISLFDTGGLDDETSSVPNYYLATADAAIFVFSLDSIASFELAKRLKTETAKIRGNDMPMLIVGTKSDLSHQRQVSKSSINSSSRDCKVKIFEIIYDEKDSLKVPFTWLVSRLAGYDILNYADN